MSNKQTAVEWLVEELNQKIHIIPMDKWDMIRDIVKQAKVMEKKQIEVAFSDGQKIPINSPTLPMYSREEYYNETYNG